MNKLEVVDFNPTYAAVFKALNEQWIIKYFKIEEPDIASLNFPEEIIQGGGAILICLYQDVAVGVCALKANTEDLAELCKFAVDENYQGLGVGQYLLEASLQKAKDCGFKRLFLEGNTRLGASIHLYRKFGFQEVPLDPSAIHYERVDILMELVL